MNARRAPRRLWQRVLGLLETGFEVMARYPYDMTEMHWQADLYDPPSDDGRNGGGGGHPAPGPRTRMIKVVPPPASQRFHAAQSQHLPLRNAKRKQPVQDGHASMLATAVNKL